MYRFTNSEHFTPSAYLVVTMQNTGCRPLSDDELLRVLANCRGRYPLRDQALITLGVYTGYRIGELLGLFVEDIFSSSGVLSKVTVQKSKMKGGRRARTVPLHARAKAAVEAWILSAGLDSQKHQKWPLFPRQTRCKPLTRHQARRIIVKAAIAGGVEPERIATHTLRKTYARRLWESPLVGKDPARMARLLGHTDWSNTLRYLQFTDLEAAVLA
jgi:integrase/recombinase XerD